MTDPNAKLIDELIESARLLGAIQAKRGFGVYTQEDAMIERAFYESIDEKTKTLRAELAKPVDITTEMAAVADRFAHKLALDLECVLADYSGTWYDAAMTTLGAYREAMNAIHERESPTFMGEPVLRSRALLEQYADAIRKGE